MLLQVCLLVKIKLSQLQISFGIRGKHRSLAIATVEVKPAVSWAQVLLYVSHLNVKQLWFGYQYPTHGHTPTDLFTRRMQAM